MAAASKNILIFVATRAILTTLAKMLCRMEKNEAIALLDTINSEIALLQTGMCDSEAWTQAAHSLKDSPEYYGLERIGFWPQSKSSS